MNYGGYFLKEAMRVDPSTPDSLPYKAMADTVVKGVTIPKGTYCAIDLRGVGMGNSQWQRPNEFLPERFDSTNPLFMKPDGKPRH